MGSYVLGFDEIDRTQVAVVGGKGAHLGELSRIDGIRVPAGFCVTTDAFRRIIAGRAVDRRTARCAVAPGPGRPGGDPHAQRRDPPDRRRNRHPRRPGGGDHRRARPARRPGRLRRAIERDGRGPADGLLRRPAGHVPERRGAGRDPPPRQPVLGLAVHRAGRDLPPAQRLRPPQGPHGRGRAADGRPAGVRRPVHGRPGHVQPEGRLRRGQLRPRRGPGLGPGERRTSTRCATARSSPRRSPPSRSPSTPRRRAGRRKQAIDPARQAQPALTDAQVVRARAAGPADRSALRPPPGHRMVPGRRRLRDRPEPADHHAVPRPGGRTTQRTTSTSRSATSR